MATSSVLVDTDIFIEFFNFSRFAFLFRSPEFRVYYSIVTKKELLSKQGLRESEQHAIVKELRRHRLIRLTEPITRRYLTLRAAYLSLEKEDALIAASALVKKLPLVTKNKKHFDAIAGLTLFGV
jgi:predicted nucleic acid-binding protein